MFNNTVLSGGFQPDMMSIVMIVIIIFIVIFLIITSLVGRKAKAKEKERRYREVRNKIKEYIFLTENRKNIRINFIKVNARRGFEYKYRDVFDVIVELIEPKTQNLIEKKSFEVEGLTTRIDKKTYQTEWVVNGETNLKDTEYTIAVTEKTIKLTKEEIKARKLLEKEKQKEYNLKQKEEVKKYKNTKKNTDDSLTIFKQSLLEKEKFIPERKK